MNGELSTASGKHIRRLESVSANSDYLQRVKDLPPISEGSRVCASYGNAHTSPTSDEENQHKPKPSKHPKHLGQFYFVASWSTSLTESKSQPLAVTKLSTEPFDGDEGLQNNSGVRKMSTKPSVLSVQFRSST
jgi:hypothetical protein